MLSLLIPAVVGLTCFIFGSFVGFFTCDFQRAREEMDRERNSW